LVIPVKIFRLMLIIIYLICLGYKYIIWLQASNLREMNS